MDKRTKLQKELNKLHEELKDTILKQQTVQDELENFLAQFTCVLDAPSCGCSEEELNDPRFEALYTEQDRLTKLSKEFAKQIKELKSHLTDVETRIEKLL